MNTLVALKSRLESLFSRNHRRRKAFGAAGGEALEIRQLLAGAPSASFGDQGKKVLDSTSGSTGQAAIQQADGRVVVAGTQRQADGSSQFAVSRIQRDGTADAGLGVQTFDFASQGYRVAEATAVAVDSQGRILAAGTVRHSLTGQTDVGLFRLDQRPVLNEFGDLEYGQLSVVTNFGLAGVNDTVSAMTIDSQGRILIAGTVDRGNGNTDFSVIRLSGDGVVDTTFGVQGRRSISFDLGGRSRDSAAAISLDPQGRILLAGSASRGVGSDFAVTRLTASGAIDTTFGVAGRASIGFDLGGGQFDSATGIDVDSQGRILVGGTATTRWGDDFVVARFLSTGTPDWTYGWGARQNISFDLATPNVDRAASMQLDYMDRVVISGTVARVTGTDFGIARLTAGGAPDLSFGPSGRRTMSFDRDTASLDQAAAMIINDRDEITVVGTSLRGNSPAVSVARLEGRHVTVQTTESILALGGTTLLVDGTSEGDTITVSIEAGTIRLPGVTWTADGVKYQDLDVSLPVSQISDLWILGAAGNDTIRIADAGAVQGLPVRIEGGAGVDTLAGGRGRDEIYGGDGDDILTGGDESDLLDGQAGNDRLDGNAGADTLYAMQGLDTVIRDSLDVVYQRTAVFDTITGILTVRGTSLGESLTVNPVAVTNLAGTKHFLTVEDTPIVIQGNGTSVVVDSLDLYRGINSIDVYALEGSDTVSVFTGFGMFFSGNGATVRVFADRGNDTVVVSAWHKEMYGGEGTDTMTSLGGSSRVEGGTEADTIFGGEGIDTIFGGDGDDYIVGNEGGDWIDAGLGNDTIFGDDENLTPAPGTMIGGRDTLYGNYGSDRIYGGEDNDTIWGGIEVDQLIAIRDVDWLYGGYLYDSAERGAGSDTMDGGMGDDWLYGGRGGDFLYGGRGRTLSNGDAPWSGSDHLFGGDGVDFLYGFEGNDKLYGGNGDDWLYGGPGNDDSFGEANNDVIYDVLGSGLMSGGADDDTIYGGSLEDWIIGGSGNDTIFGGGGTDNISGDDPGSALGGNDTIFGGEQKDTIAGGPGNDTIYGNGGNDLIHGNENNDSIWGGSGENEIYGDGGDDLLTGGPEKDWLYGGTGNDGLFGGGGGNYLEGGADNDRFLLWREGNGFFSAVDVGNNDMRINMTDQSRVWTPEEIVRINRALIFTVAATGDNRLLMSNYTTQPRNVIEMRREVSGNTAGSGPAWAMFSWIENKSFDIWTLSWKSSFSSWYSVYDAGMAGSDSQLSLTMFHEVGHNWGATAMSTSWLNFSGWARGPAGSGRTLSRDGNWSYLNSQSGTFFRPYGTTNPDEDWSTIWEAWYTRRQGTLSAADQTRLSAKLAFVDNFIRGIR